MTNRRRSLLSTTTFIRETIALHWIPTPRLCFQILAFPLARHLARSRATIAYLIIILLCLTRTLLFSAH